MSFWKKKPDTAPQTSTAPVDSADVGTAADVEEVMKKYDRESNVRVWEGIPGLVVKALMAGFSLFCLYLTLFDTSLPEFRLTLFLALIIIIGYLNYPARRGHVRANYMPWYDIVIMVAGCLPFFYFAFNANRILNTSYTVLSKDPLMLAMAVVGILALMELCRRSVGIPILCVVGILLVYTFANVRFGKVLYDLFYTTNGVMGTPINVCQKYIVVFIIFGAFLERTGISNFFINLANCVAGSAAGGPAKVAVISSALCGMVSGSSVGNTVTTGSVTIPMMKKTGYKGEFAGAVEAAASTGGQIMPPIMGAAAFIIAEMLGVGYTDVMKAAIMPALLYYVAIFMAVHLYAKKNRITGIPKEAEDELPSVGYLLKKGGYLLLPLLLLLVLVVFFKKSPQYAALWSTLAIIALSWLRKDTRITPRKAMEAMKSAALGIVPISIVCCAAGVVMGVFTVTGLGLKISAYIVNLANGNLFVLCLLAFLCSILLGMGLPTVACYMLLAILVAPAMIECGVYPMAAHMFGFYFGIVSAITPPVAIAAFVGAGIAKAKPMQVGFTACTIALPAFFVPFIFVYQPALLFYGTPLEVIQVCFTSTLGALLCAVATQGYFFSKLKGWERILAGLSAIAMLIPETITDFIGIAGLILVFILSTLRARRQKEVNAAQ